MLGMKVTALAGGIGAGKFLRGLVRVVPGDDLTVIVNTADDIVVHGLHVSPDPDSVTYWLGDAFDRERGWGRRDESFRATEELAAFDGSDGHGSGWAISISAPTCSGPGCWQRRSRSRR